MQWSGDSTLCQAPRPCSVMAEIMGEAPSTSTPVECSGPSLQTLVDVAEDVAKEDAMADETDATGQKPPKVLKRPAARRQTSQKPEASEASPPAQESHRPTSEELERAPDAAQVAGTADATAATPKPPHEVEDFFKEWVLPKLDAVEDKKQVSI